MIDKVTIYDTVNINTKEKQTIITITGEPTVGEIIQSVFPHIDFERRDDVVDVYNLSKYSITFTQDMWDIPYKQFLLPHLTNPGEHSCFKCRYLGWECVGEGITPVCEQEPYIDEVIGSTSTLHKSKPTVSDKNDCYWFDEKEK